MKNQNTKIIVKRILTFFMLICLIKIVDAQEQSCRTWLKSARDYRAEGKYNEAIKMYNKVIKQCPDYNNIVANELKECQSKLKGNSNKTNPKKTSGGYVPVHQHATGSISNVEPYFDAAGDCLNETNVIRVSLNDWDFLVNESCRDWLHVERSGNSLIVTCSHNPNKEERTGSIVVFGEINDQIVVTQYGITSSKSTTRTKHTVQTDYPEAIEEQPIIVKITFENGKAKPKFDNNIGRLITALGENNNLDLQIEVYKCESQSGLKNFIKAPLIDKRFKEIMEYFGSFEIATDRISKNIIVIDGDKEGAECNCAYAKTRKKE